jgi:glycosyltransferase involved in cell wall biosynthesis
MDKNRKIKILRVVTRLNIGGPAIHVRNLSNNLNQKKFITKLVTGSLSPGEGDMEYILKKTNIDRIFIPELHRDISIYNDIITLIKLIIEIHRFKPDILDSHTSKAGAISRVAAFLLNPFIKKITTVHTFHGNVLEGYFSKPKSFLLLSMEKLLAIFTNRIIAISSSQKEDLVKHYKISNSNKIVTIKLGFELDPFIYSKKMRGIFRREIGVNHKTILVGIIGRLTPIKNHHLFLISALNFLSKSNGLSVKFIIIGDGELKKQLKAYAKKIGIEDQVIFYGWKKDIVKVYADLDILALTSMNEGTPVSIIEAMASFVPVISTDVGGVRDLLGNQMPCKINIQKFKVCERGVLCPNKNPIAFADGIDYLIHNVCNQKSKMTANAHKYVVSNYEVQSLVRKMEALYEGLVLFR